DTGISLEQARGARVYHNTVVSADSATEFFSSIDYRFANSVVEIRDNPARRRQRGGADAYRGNRQYDRAKAEYDRALQLFPNYADAVFNLGILYLDADRMPHMDLFAKQNTAIQYLQRYKQMMGGTLPPSDPADSYIAEAQEKIKKAE